MSLRILIIWGLVTPRPVSLAAKRRVGHVLNKGKQPRAGFVFLTAMAKPDIALDSSGFVAQLFVCNLKDEKQGTTHGLHHGFRKFAPERGAHA